MCQLLGMNCNVPTDICFSFEGFTARGGHTDEHRDGWGIAFFEGQACRTFHDVQASANSEIANLLHRYPIKSLNTIAHIRKASIGGVNLANTHPFQREAWGQQWIFAHNGDLWNYNPQKFSHHHPVGTSDSEMAFCSLLNALREEFPDACPELPVLYKKLHELSEPIAKFGTFNFLLSNGQYLFARCSTKLVYIIREAPFKNAHLIDRDIAIDFTQHTTADDRVAVIATEPLTDDEEWTTFKAGELLVFENGQVVNL